MNKSMCGKTINQIFSQETDFSIIAGPCSVESQGQITAVAQLMAQKGCKFLRGGAFKPRTNPDNFQGLGKEGLVLLSNAAKAYGLISVTELTDVRDLELVASYCDVIQVGSRSMYNYAMLKELGKTKLPVILKRSFMATADEFIFASRYILEGGNPNIILCERGIRTFEVFTRNTLDIAALAYLKQYSGLSVIADLSHSLGRTDILLPVARAVKALGADGIMVEVHPNPTDALSDSKQQLDFMEFDALLREVK